MKNTVSILDPINVRELLQVAERQHRSAFSRSTDKPCVATCEVACRLAALVRELTEYRPIETAPKDGTLIRAVDADGEITAWWNPEAGRWWTDCLVATAMLTNDPVDMDAWYISPTHWLPLPPLPAPEGE